MFIEINSLYEYQIPTSFYFWVNVFEVIATDGESLCVAHMETYTVTAIQIEVAEVIVYEFYHVQMSKGLDNEDCHFFQVYVL